MKWKKKESDGGILGPMNAEASEIELVNGTTNPYLEISGLEFSYGEVKVLHGLEFKLVAESIGCVMGRKRSG